MWRLLGTIVDDKNLRQLIAIFSVSAVLQGIALAMMIPFLQELLGGGPRVGTWLGVLVGLAVVSFVVEFYGIMRSYRISVYDVCDALIEKIADHTLQLPLGWFDAKREAQIASAMSREIDTLSHVASIIIPALVKQFVTPAVIVIAVLIVDWRLALIMIACVPLLRWGWLYMQKSIVKVDEVQAQAAADSAGRLIEYARLQPILRANGVTQRGGGCWRMPWLGKTTRSTNHCAQRVAQTSPIPALFRRHLPWSLLLVWCLCFGWIWTPSAIL